MNYADTRHGRRCDVPKEKNIPSINKENNGSCLRQMIDSERKRNGKKEMIPYSNFHGVRFFPLSRQRSVLFPFVICRFALCTEDVWVQMKRELVSWASFLLLPFLFPPFTRNNIMKSSHRFG